MSWELSVRERLSNATPFCNPDWFFKGTICWTAQLVPQIWKSFRSKSTEGLSDWLV